MPDRVKVRALADRLEAAAHALLAEAAALPPELVTWKPAPDVWSVMEILGHVAEFIPYWTGQALQVIQHPGEPWGRAPDDTARLGAVERASGRSLDDMIAAIRSAAKASASAIRGLRDPDLDAEAMSRNPRWGRKPATFLIDELLIHHVEKHLGQVRRNVAQFRQRGETAR